MEYNSTLYAYKVEVEVEVEVECEAIVKKSWIFKKENKKTFAVANSIQISSFFLPFETISMLHYHCLVSGERIYEKC